MKYYILDMEGNLIPIPFDSVEEAENFGINSGWKKFNIIQFVKQVIVK